MLITFSGLDGAGKTSLIQWLRAHLEHRDRSVAVLHMNEDVGVYAYLQTLRDHVRGTRRPADAPPRPLNVARTRWERMRDAIVWSKWLRRVLYPVDLMIFLLYRAYLEKLRGRILIMDRYFYDRLVDVADRNGWSLLRVFARLTPTPDLPVFLDITPEESFARKGEYSVEYLRSREARYRAVVPWIRSAVIVPNCGLEAAKRTLARAVAERIGL